MPQDGDAGHVTRRGAAEAPARHSGAEVFRPRWYSTEWDDDFAVFKQEVPQTGDVVTVAMSDAKGRPLGDVTGTVVCEPVDKHGMSALMTCQSSESADLRALVDTELGLHFCSHSQCQFNAADIVHVVRWKILRPATGGMDGGGRGGDAESPAGTPLFPEASRLRDLRNRLFAKRSAGDGSARPAAEGPANDKKTSIAALLAKRVQDATSSNEASKARSLETAPDALPPKRRKRSHSDYSPNRSSSDDDQVFRKAPSVFKESAIHKIASQESGALLENGVKMMQNALASRQGGGEVSGKEREQLVNLRTGVTNYLTVGLMPGCAAAGQPIGRRSEREMRTLAEAIDAILRGDVATAGDIMMQRFRACELAALEGDWTLAKHLELIPQERVTSIPRGMREALVKEENQLAKYTARKTQEATQRPGSRDPNG